MFNTFSMMELKALTPTSLSEAEHCSLMERCERSLMKDLGSTALIFLVEMIFLLGFGFEISSLHIMAEWPEIPPIILRSEKWYSSDSREMNKSRMCPRSWVGSQTYCLKPCAFKRSLNDEVFDDEVASIYILKSPDITKGPVSNRRLSRKIANSSKN